MASESIQDQDYRLAAAVQQALLEVQLPECKCGHLYLKNRMSSRIGGDFYYFRDLGNEQSIFAVGDIAGHSYSSALLMTLVMGHLQANSQDYRRPARMADSVNKLLLQLGERMKMPITCSMIFGFVDLPSGILLYVNAGHPHPLIINRQNGRSAHLPPTTLLLGVLPGTMPESCHQFVKQDRLILFTDGLTEAPDRQGNYFTEARLHHLVEQEPAMMPETLGEKIFQAVESFAGRSEPQDDQTLVIIDFDNISTEFM